MLKLYFMKKLRIKWNLLKIYSIVNRQLLQHHSELDEIIINYTFECAKEKLGVQSTKDKQKMNNILLFVVAYE